MLGSCSEETVEKVDCTKSDLAIGITKTKYADCGLSNGEITVEAAGGKAPYRYSIDGGNLQSSAIFVDVVGGLHVMAVLDANNCTVSVNTFMGNKEPFAVNSTATPSGCGDDKGTITVTPLGGKPPYKYQLGENNDNYQLTNTWQGLKSGRYSIWVDDSNNCFFGIFVTVPSGISYSASIAPIIETKCAISTCHNGSQVPDFRAFATVKANADKIKSKVLDLTMPPGNPLSFEEIQAISCWADDGAPNN